MSITISRLRTIHPVILACLLLLASQTALSAHVMVFVDLSDSAGSARNDYFADFRKFPLKPGDTVILLPLGQGTHNYAPFIKVQIPAPNPSYSPTRNSEAQEEAKMQLFRALKGALARPDMKSTSILGAFVAASDYFTQQRIAPRDRVIYILSDMIEQSADTGINMKRAIPDAPPANLSLPTNLGATVHVVGVSIDAKNQGKLRAFWDNTIKRCGATLDTYRQRY
ncbi:MAG: hypothetical protein IPG66_18455 [Hydrogenophilales bacterium]|nr:hypothetical protein [Hydrogenophilales bacterium]